MRWRGAIVELVVAALFIGFAGFSLGRYVAHNEMDGAITNYWLAVEELIGDYRRAITELSAKTCNDTIPTAIHDARIAAWRTEIEKTFDPG